MNFFAQLTSGGSRHGSRHNTRSGAYSHRSAKESVGRRVHADTQSLSRSSRESSSSSRIGVGTALVMLQETHDGPRPPPIRVLNPEGKLIPKDHFFLAVLAPDNDQALAFLAVQPAGTFVLVRQSADDLAVYVKFHSAVRSFTVIRGKDLPRAKPTDDLVEWGRAYRPLAVHTRHADALLAQPTQMTPVHRLVLPPVEFAYLARCWLAFLPQVQAMAFELCTQPYYMDEAIAMDGWDQLLLASRVPCVAFVSVDTCGFHLFNTTAIAAAAAVSCATETHGLNASSLAAANATVSVPVRVVEFDIAKCLISIADGVFRPNAIVSPVHFGAAKLYDAALSFQAIRENFLTPARVFLKEVASAFTATSSHSPLPPAWHDLHSEQAAAGDDAELQLLLEVRALVACAVPHESLPEGLLDAISRLHTLWTTTPSRSRWRTLAKIQCGAQILPFYVELLLATASTDPYVAQELSKSQTRDPLPAFAARRQQDLRVMARRADDASVSRLCHHVLQTLALRACVPSRLVSLVSDLCVESLHFRVLFLRNQGISLLWKATHTPVPPLNSADDDNDADADAALALPLLIQRINPLLSELTKRRSSLFGNRRKSHQTTGAARKSLAFNASIVMPVTVETTVQVFFRLNPLLVQLELAASAELRRQSDHSETESSSSSSSTSSSFAMVACIERLAFLLLADASSPTWEKDVLQLLRMDNLYDDLYQQLVTGVLAMGSASSTNSIHMETMLECIAALYRLETKRRRHAGPTIGEKKYWFLFHLLRTPIRAFHEHMRELLLYAMETDASALDCDDLPASSAGVSTASATASLGLTVLAHVLPRLPRQMVTEFVLVSLDDVLQATRILHEYLERNPRLQRLPHYVDHVRLLIVILTVVLQRTCDVDLQLLLVRVLASSGSTVPAMLERLVQAASASPASSAESLVLQQAVLSFADAFLVRAASLSQRERWHATRESLILTLENRYDVGSNEQRKTMLMATVLSPENGVADSDEILWDTLQELLVPVAPRETSDPRLAVVECVYAYTVGMLGSSIEDPAVMTVVVKQYLRVRARAFLSPILETSPSQLRGLVAFHWHNLCELRGQFQGNSKDQDKTLWREELALLHLQCLQALASRRGQLPAMDKAFVELRTARTLLQILQQQGSTSHSPEVTMTENAPVELGLSLNLKKLLTASPHTTNTAELLIASPALHAATLLTILACVLREPHALDETLVPRFFLPAVDNVNDDILSQEEDLLLSLQRYLERIDSAALRGAIYAGLHEAEVDHQWGGPARVHAVRVLVRLLLPDSYDAALYASSTRNHHKRPRAIHADASDCGEEEEEEDATHSDGDEDISLSRSRTYIARGAFASVYRATPCVGSAGDVAIKVCAHQRSSGERCVAAEVFNEIVVLERLRGNRAATQLLDYGNNTKESLGWELVLEHCPASLTQWRRSLALRSSGGSPPFRTLLSLTLGVFLEVASAVQQIHASDVCHFDIKADNVLLRVEPHKMTAELLRDHNEEGSTMPPRVCLADFGESAIITEPGRALQLTRTRGTEAIKSPEMLRVTGGQPTTNGDGVGPASDVWSLGCLLVEMITEDVMFANDDWAQLYAHVVAPSDSRVVRDDHQQKLLAVLTPTTDAEKGLANKLLLLLESILDRDALRRPTIATLIDEVQTQRSAVLSLPPQPEDDAFCTAVLLALAAQDAPNSPAHVANSVAPPSSLAHLHWPPADISVNGHGPMAGRLFSNFFLARGGSVLRPRAATLDANTLSLPNEKGKTNIGDRTLLANAQWRHELSALQLLIEPRVDHVIYFCYDDVQRQITQETDVDTDGRFGFAAAVHSSSSSNVGAFLEIVEGVGRTVFYFSRARVLACLQPDHSIDHRQTSSVGHSVASARGSDKPTPTLDATTSTNVGPSSLVRLLFQHSRGILATLQRHLRHQSGRVLLVPVDYDALDDANNPNDANDTNKTNDSPLEELTVATMLFFLTTSLALSPLEAVACFSRECHAVAAAVARLPSACILTQLMALHEELREASNSVVSVERSLHNRACVRCRCGDKVLAVAAAEISLSGSRFVPPAVDVDVDGEIVWDPHETALVVGDSSSSARPWVVVDTLAADRLDSLLRTVLRRQLGVAAATTRERHHSHGQLGTRHATTTGHLNADETASALREHVPFLLHGLSEVHTPTNHAATTAAEMWTLYECGQCGARVCAVHATADKLALPL